MKKLQEEKEKVEDEDDNEIKMKPIFKMASEGKRGIKIVDLEEMENNDFDRFVTIKDGNDLDCKVINEVKKIIKQKEELIKYKNFENMKK